MEIQTAVMLDGRAPDEIRDTTFAALENGWRSRTDFEQGLRCVDAMSLQDLLNIRLGVRECSSTSRLREIRYDLESADELPVMDHAYGDWGRNAGEIANGLSMTYYPWDVMISLMHGFHSRNDELSGMLSASLRRRPASLAYLIYSLARLLGGTADSVASYASSDLKGMADRLDLADRATQFFYLYHAFRIGQAKYAAREVWKNNDVKLGCIQQTVAHLFNEPEAVNATLSRFEALMTYLNAQVRGMAGMDEATPYLQAIRRFFDAHELDAGSITGILPASPT